MRRSRLIPLALVLAACGGSSTADSSTTTTVATTSSTVATTTQPTTTTTQATTTTTQATTTTTQPTTTTTQATTTTTQPTTTTTQAGPSGSTIYSLHCATCHGVNGEGGVGVSLIDSTLSFSEIVSVVTNGRNGMPAWNETLTPEEIDAVSAYAKSLQG